MEKLIREIIYFLDSKNKEYVKGNMDDVIKYFIKSKYFENFIYKSPTYLFDRKQLLLSIKEFQTAFENNIPNNKIFYAMKSNDYSGIVDECIKSGLGIDVSSERELDIANECGAKQIIFSGPAKTDSELKSSLKNTEKLIIHIDSFSELKRLGEFAQKAKKKIKAGVRVNTKYHGKWTKFGIPLSKLSDFWKESYKYEYIELQGIQCHMSWNTDSRPYKNIIVEIAKELKNSFNPNMLFQIKFIDLGGGFSLNAMEGTYPWGTPQGKFLSILEPYINKDIQYKDKYYIDQSVSLKSFAKGISNAITKNLQPLLGDIKYFFEPGRVISTSSMHIAFKIVDIKDGFAIADAGTNMTGWEKRLNAYFPLINLTHPSNKEIPFRIYGALCTPDDIWGYYCYASKIEEGDIIIAPNRGAYTYAFRQDFIKGIPKVTNLD